MISKQKNLLQSVPYIIEKFYNTNFGPAYVDTETIISLNFINIIKTMFKKKRFFIKTIILNETVRVLETPITTKRIAKLLCNLTNKKIFNYWKYAEIIFITDDVCVNDNSSYKEYSFLSIRVTHDLNKVHLTCGEEDVLMLFFLVHNKISIFKFYNINVEKHFLNPIDLFLEICENRQIVLITDSNEDELISIMTYPELDGKSVEVKFLE